MTHGGSRLEVCFVDVAQGSANVILLGDRRAVVIDCGAAQAPTLFAVLRHFGIDTIARLIVTHSHDDHSRGAAAVLTAFRGRIDELWMLDDVRRPESLFWQRVSEELGAGHLHRRQIRRLDRDDRPKQIYRDGRTLLSLIAPDCVTNFRAVDDRDPNFTSAVLILKHGDRQVLFTGDSTVAEWREIMELRERPFACDILTVPHHAGAVWERRRAGETPEAFEARVREELDWLYSRAIRATVGVVSVGTNNQFRHPRPEVMDALRRASVLPVCTQMTRQCTPDLEAQRGRSLPMLLPSRSVTRRDVNDSGRSRNVACAGTVLVELRADGCVIHRHPEHQTLVDDLATRPGGNPLCRAAPAANAS